MARAQRPIGSKTSSPTTKQSVLNILWPNVSPPPNSYFENGAAFGLLAAFAAFFGSWIYCVSTYGFLFGLGLGWLPSIFVAAIAFGAIALLWVPFLLFAAYLLVMNFVAGPPEPWVAALVVVTGFLILLRVMRTAWWRAAGLDVDAWWLSKADQLPKGAVIETRSRTEYHAASL